MAGYIYIIQPYGGGPIKIGWSKSCESRLKELQIGSPFTLALIARKVGTIEDERSLHARLRDCRSHGEWFFPSVSVRLTLTELGFEWLGKMRLSRHMPTPDAASEALEERKRKILESEIARPISCSFCSKTAREVTKLIQGPETHILICNECVALCQEMIRGGAE